ncbi:MAG: hypothetical protein M1825_003497 [Sarcosagium campestre]|nr:MAG: hypothetical protein M1825_003497 [Sarcosagium campestre]
MAERRASFRSHYIPPSVETVLEYSDDEDNHSPKSSRERMTSNVQLASRSSRKNARANGGHRSSSPPSSAEKEKRRRAHREQGRRSSSSRSHAYIHGLPIEDDSSDRQSGFLRGASPYCGAKLASTSVLSTVTSSSGFTSASGGSSGSNSTVTQESVTKSRRNSVEVVGDLKADEKSSHEKVQGSPTEDEAAEPAKGPNVFSFLEEDPNTTQPLNKSAPILMLDTDTNAHLDSSSGQSRLTDATPLDTPESSPDGKDVSIGVWAHQDWPIDQTDHHPENSEWSPENVSPKRVNHDEDGHLLNISPGSSLHSDSGISMRDDSPEPYRGASLETHPKISKRALNTIVEGGSQRNITPSNEDFYHGNHQSLDGYQRLPFDAVPEQRDQGWPRHEQHAYHETVDHRAAAAEQRFHQQGMPYTSDPHAAATSKQPTPTLSGYELLATSLSSYHAQGSNESSHLVPVYRKFEHLNHRLLLHLQDELSALEEELRLVDEAAAQAHALANGGLNQRPRQPESRRFSEKHGGELHWIRLDVLGRIFTKLGQYNHALASYNSLTREVTPAKVEDVTRYRAWLNEHAPVSERERAFLGHDGDLLAVSAPHQDQRGSTDVDKAMAESTSNTLSEQQRQEAVRLVTAILAAAVLFPILTFAMVSWFFMRLVVVVGVAATAMSMLSPSSAAGLMSKGEWGFGVAL